MLNQTSRKPECELRLGNQKAVRITPRFSGQVDVAAPSVPKDFVFSKLECEVTHLAKRQQKRQ